ncbi:MAG: hypothetical protein ACD_80C00181G0012, partial [uncultured bacterium (gcode 4)]
PFLKGEAEGRGICKTKYFLNPPVLRTTPPLKKEDRKNCLSQNQKLFVYTHSNTFYFCLSPVMNTVYFGIQSDAPMAVAWYLHERFFTDK